MDYEAQIWSSGCKCKGPEHNRPDHFERGKKPTQQAPVKLPPPVKIPPPSQTSPHK